jgi:hypothetical protein
MRLHDGRRHSSLVARRRLGVQPGWWRLGAALRAR